MNSVVKAVIGLFILFVTSCNLCNDKHEPLLEVVYVDTTERLLPYDIIRVEGQDFEINISYWGNSIPLNPQSDSTAFLFVGPDRIDTLVLKYTIWFEYRSEKCGFDTHAKNIRIERFSGFKDVWLNDKSIRLFL